MSALTRSRAAQTEEIPVSFMVESDDFAVPEWSGLRCSATFEAAGTVCLDHSGDHVTPNGPPTVDVCLWLVQAHEIGICRDDLFEPLPEWLQKRLLNEDSHDFEQAFLRSIGGQAGLDQRAIDKVCG